MHAAGLAGASKALADPGTAPTRVASECGTASKLRRMAEKLQRLAKPQLKHSFPSYALFRLVCRAGLSQIRPAIAKDSLADAWGWNYGSASPPSYWAYGRLRALLTLNVAQTLSSARVFEIAAGDGALSACLQRDGSEVTVNDLRAEALRSSVLNFSNADRIKIAPGNVFDMDPACLGTFDLVIACELIEHVADSFALLSKLKSFLAPNGRILVTTPNGAYFRNKLPTFSQVRDREGLRDRQFKPDADGHLFLFTPEELESAAEQTGLTVESSLVWGTPFISGESGLRLLGRVLPSWLCFGLELFSSYLPYPVRRFVGNSLLFVLRSREFESS